MSIPVVKKGSVSALAHEKQQQAKPVNNNLPNELSSIFMVRYFYGNIYFYQSSNIELYPNSAEIILAYFRIIGADSSTTDSDKRSLGPDIQIAPHG